MRPVLTRVDAGRLTVVLSPGGRSFAHVREDRATKQGSLNLVALKDGRTRELVRFGADKEIMVNGWTPDSKSLIYSQREGSGRLSDGSEYPAFATWIVPVEGGTTRKIGEFGRSGCACHRTATPQVGAVSRYWGLGYALAQRSPFLQPTNSPTTLAAMIARTLRPQSWTKPSAWRLRPETILAPFIYIRRH